MNLNDLRKEIPYRLRKGPGGKDLAYIDARQVQDLLDEVCGPANWQSDFRVIGDRLFAGIGINVDGQWVWKWDTGCESNIEPEKGEASDALKRAAVQWGIGRFLYSLKPGAFAQGNGSSKPVKSQTQETGEVKKAQCRSCTADVWWGETKNGKPCPYDWGTDTSHFITCPNAQQHSSKQHKPKMISETDINTVKSLLKKAGTAKTSEEKYLLIGGLIGREINQLADLTDQEAEQVIIGLREMAGVK